ncbi:MAG: NTPase family-like protein [Gemmatimonadetes bacterium]|nr:NTPase family-like protein [Gemmatimonadota bacterium]
MQSDRVTQVFSADSRGSGYLIAPTLVLTAAHVIGDEHDTIEVRTVAALERGDRTRMRATLVLCDTQRDLALLLIPPQPVRAATMLGKLSGNIPVPVDTLGFPDATLQNGTSDTFAVSGDCHPQSGLLHGRMQVRISSLVPRRREDWAGLSGAAVFAGSHLVGVMRSVPAEFSSGVLEASAIAPWLKDDTLRDLLHSAGMDVVAQPVDADAVRPFGAAGFDAVCERYRAALLSSFRLDGAGLAVDGATQHALALERAYAGTRYQLKGRREPYTALANERRLVLLGAPGSGKSVTLKRLLATVSERDGRIPVYLRLADFAVALEDEDDATAATFVQAFAERAATLGVADASARLFERLLVHGDVVIALDGFDEIGGKVSRERISRAIGQLSDAAPNVDIIVSSRPAEYLETPLPEPTVAGLPAFVTAETLPLEGEEAAEFLRVCFDDDGTLSEEIRASAQLQELAQTPLLLTLLAVLGRRGRLPTNASDILAAIVSTALESWETSKRRKSTPAMAAQARHALEDLALAMQQRETPASPLAQAQALRAMRVADSTLMDWLVKRSGLVIRYEQQGATSTRLVIQFLHLQLQEYLAGCGLARRLMAAGDEGWVILEKWGGPSEWREAQRFAATELARAEAFDTLEKWVEKLLEGPAPSDAPEYYSMDAALQGAELLSRADAEFFPAPTLEGRVVQRLDELNGLVQAPTVMLALCWMLPRVGSLEAVREIALLTPRGLAWMCRTTPATGIERSVSEDEALAACIRGLCEFGDPVDAGAAIDAVTKIAGDLHYQVGAWPALAPWVQQLRGDDMARQYLRDIALLSYWAAEATPYDVLRILETIALLGHRELADALALEGCERTASNSSTAGYVQWLEAHPSDAGLEAVDRYYERLRDVVANEMGSFDWPKWWQLPIWPARASAAADALRLQTLGRPQAAWHIIHDAVGSGLHHEQAREVWLEIVRHEYDRSIRVALVTRMLEEQHNAIVVPLVLEALGWELVDRWSGEQIVRNLRGRGKVAEVKERLNAVLSNPSTTEEHAELLRTLLQVADE